MGRSKEDLTDAEVIRLAARIYFSSLCQIQQGSEPLDENEIMKRHILLCPYLSPNSLATQGALLGLELSTADKTNQTAPTITPDVAYSEVKATMNRANEIVEPATPHANKRRSRILGTLIRSIVFDTPLVLLFASYLFFVWVHRVHDMYLTTQMKALVWDDDRAFREMTYYRRECDSSDMSAKGSHELFLSYNATANEAYDHQLLHGMTVFPEILSDETATALRNFVVSRNRNLRDEESIFVIENTNRFSFGLGTEEPSVSKAMSEIGSNERLVSAMEMIMGKNPALIEMTAITAAYGAVDQYWHDDVVARASALKYGRTFGPSYSLFIQLQNTTKDMGATSSCPGTHMCPHGLMDIFCEEEGFQLVNADGYWRTGDAMLMNMNTWHRGAAHTDPNAPDRVMLILTFVPKPRTRAETRQMSQGITFSLRWDMWGHTLKDLAQADTAMAQPWATLRALGLYKKPNADWGIDYVTSATMRMANLDNGFRRDELDDFVARGGFKWLPTFLHGEYSSDESWPEFLLDTVIRCETLLQMMNAYAVSGYLLLFLAISVTIGSQGSDGRKNRWRRFGYALLRISIAHSVVFALYRVANKSVDNTDWAKDLKAGRLYTYPIHNEKSTFLGPSTLPLRSDVLIETRYASEYLGMYNDFTSVHPGNRMWTSLLQDGAGLFESYSALPHCFREGLAEYIVGSVQNEAGRFLYQDQDSHWIILSSKDAIQLTTFELSLIASPIRYKLRREVRFLVSECKYGYLRDTAMTRANTMAFLKDLHSRLFEEEQPKHPFSKIRVETTQEGDDQKHRPMAVFHRSFEIPKVAISARHAPRHTNLHVGMPSGEPQYGAWIQEGDMVEVSYRDNGRLYWYKARVILASSSAYILVEFEGKNDREYVTSSAVRRYTSPEVNEWVELLFDEEEAYYLGEIVSSNDDGTFSVHVTKYNVVYEGVDGALIRRRK